MCNRPNLFVLLLVISCLGAITPSALLGAERNPGSLNGPVLGPRPVRTAEPMDVDKFLFIMSTSSEMEDLEHGGRQALFDLIHSGVSRYMRKGDTFGVWSFNSKLNAGQYPMQVWDPTNTVELATQATLFIEQQNYRGRSDMDEAMVGVHNVMQAVKDANIFIISDYKTKISGTPFDDDMNAIYKERYRDARENEKPFITTILARSGKMALAQITLDGESITLPTRPLPLPEVEIAVKTKVTPPKTTTSRSDLNAGKPEIIISRSGTVSKRSQSGIIMSGPSPDGKPSISQPDLAKLQDNSSAIITSEFEQVFPQSLANNPLATAPVAAAPVAAAPVATAPVATAPVATAPVATTPVATAPVATTPVAAAPGPDSSQAAPEPVPVQQPVATTQAKPSPQISPAPEISPNHSIPVKTETPSILSSLAPKPMPVSAREGSHGQPISNRLGMASNSMTALVTPVERGSRMAFWFFAGAAGLLLMGVVGGMYWLVQRRSAPAETSYITKSLYRK